MRMFTSGMVLLAAVAAAGFATAAAPDTRQPSSVQGRQVMICAQDVATRRAFARQHGAAPIFITASEARAIRRTNIRWTSPRCMTEREHGLYQSQTQTFAALR